MLSDATKYEKYAMTIDIIRQIAFTGCRRDEIIGLKWDEVDTAASCHRLMDSKEGASVQPIGLLVVEFLEARCEKIKSDYVFPGLFGDKAFGNKHRDDRTALQPSHRTDAQCGFGGKRAWSL
jgi:integrase